MVIKYCADYAFDHRWCKQASGRHLEDFWKHWINMEDALAEKRALNDKAVMLAAARGRRIFAATTSGASKQRCEPTLISVAHAVTRAAVFHYKTLSGQRRSLSNAVPDAILL